MDFNVWWWGGLALFLSLFHGNHILNNDEGVVIDGAWNMLHGRQLYIDFFEFITPGSFYLIYIPWKILGPHYWIANIIAIAVVFISAVGIYKMCKMLTANASSIIPPAIFIFSSFNWPIINHNMFNIALMIWGTYFFLKGIKNKSIGLFVSSGLFIGLSMLFLQHKGAAVFIAMSGFLLFLRFIYKRKYWTRSLTVFAVCSLVPLLVLFKWPLEILYSNLIQFVLFQCAEINKTSLVLSIFFLFILLIFIFIIKKNRLKEVTFLFFLQFVLLLTTFAQSDNFHVGIAIFPILVLIPVAVDALKNEKQIIKLACGFLFFIATWLIMYPSIKYVTTFPLFYSVKDTGAIEYIKQHCDDKYDLYAGPFMPGMYYETGKLNPTSYPWLITNHHTKKQFAHALTQLELHKPKCAVTDYKNVQKFRCTQNNLVGAYIQKNYEIVETTGDVQIFKRK